MEPTDDHNLSGGGHSGSGDYYGGCPVGTFHQQEQEEEDHLMSLWLSPPPAEEEDLMSLWLSPPPAEGFAGPENFGNGGQISALDEMLPNYAAAPAEPLVEATHGTSEDELPRPQQQLPLLTNDPEAQPGGGSARLDLSPVDEVKISTDQPPSHSPTINPGPDEANHAASAPMGSQDSHIPAAPQDQEANILSRASTRCRDKSKGLPSRQQDGSDNLFFMGIDMMRQFGRPIGKMLKDEEHRSKVWEHFWRSQCRYCDTVTVICQYCNTVMRDPSSIDMLRHHNIHLLPASSGASKETQWSSQALQIEEIAESPNSESEPVETDNSNCDATAAWVDTQGTNAVVLSPWQQNQLPMDREEQMAKILSYQRRCCKGPYHSWNLVVNYTSLDQPESWWDLIIRPSDEPKSWWDLIIRLSDSSYCSSTTKNTHDGFRLKFSNKALGYDKIAHVHSSAAWMHVSEKDCKYHAGVALRTGSATVGSSYLFVGLSPRASCDQRSAPAGCTYSWKCMHFVLRSLGFRKEFARNLVIYALGWVDSCNLRLRSPACSSDKKGESIVAEQGDDDVPSGKRKRKPAPTRSKVWNHFTKEVEAQGSMVTMARCNHCGSKLRADSASHGTTHLKRHITSKHPEEAKSLI